MSSGFSTLPAKKQSPNLRFFPQGHLKQFYREYCYENKGHFNFAVFTPTLNQIHPLKIQQETLLRVNNKAKELLKPLHKKVCCSLLQTSKDIPIITTGNATINCLQFSKLT